MIHRFDPSKVHVLENKERILMYKKFFDEIMYFLENKVVMDVGCGTGVITDIIAEHAKKVYAIDISKDRIEMSKLLSLYKLFTKLN